MPLVSKSHLRKLISPVHNPTYNIYILFFTSIYSIVKKENRKKSLARSIKFNLVTVSFDRLLSEGLSKPVNLQESKGMKKNTYSSPQTKSSGPRPGRSIQAVILVQSNEK